MTFAIAMSLVLLVSTSVLLYQFWTRSLLGDEPDDPAIEQTADTAAPYFEQAA